MIKKKNAFNALVTAALLSAIPALANEQSDDKGFIPYEQLQPEQRVVVEEKVRALLLHIKIDFRTVKVGVDSEGNIVFMGRTEDEIKSTTSNPTCWTK